MKILILQAAFIPIEVDVSKDIVDELEIRLEELLTYPHRLSEILGNCNYSRLKEATIIPAYKYELIINI